MIRILSHLKANLVKHIILPVISITILTCNFQPVKAEPLDINAQSAILIDAKTGQVLYEHNAHEKVYPASTTKIMTAVLALERGDLSKTMTASLSAVNDIGKDGMNIGLIAGEEVRLDNLLNALMIRSANETANIIAENISSTRAEFIALMNKRAAELGATNTNFVNPCGKDSAKEDINHLSTASDMAKIARHAMSIPKFREIVSTKFFSMPASNKHPETFWPVYASTNKLLMLNKYKSTQFTVTGIKTGYTDKAGNNLVSAAKGSDGMELISVVFGVKNAPPDSVFEYSKTLLEYGFKNYALQKVVDSNQLVKNVPVADAANNATLDLVTAQELFCALPTDKSSWNIVSKEQIKTDFTAPVHQGDVMGYIEYERNGISLGKVDIVASTSIEKSFQAKSLSRAKEATRSHLLRLVIIMAGIIPVLFFILRRNLRKTSRYINSRRIEGRFIKSLFQNFRK